jgi:integrase
MSDSSAAPRLVRVPGKPAWHVYYARRRVSTGETSRPAALRFLADFVADLHPGPPPSAITVADVLARYLEDREDLARPGVERIRWSCKPLTRHLGGLLAEGITDKDCRAYQRARAADGVVSTTTRIEMASLRAAVRWAAHPKRKILTVAPDIEMPDKAEPRDRWLDPAEFDKLVAAAAAPHVRLAMLLALHTAARHAAILGLTWDRVNLDRGLIDYREPGAVKSSKRRVPVPINVTLLAVLLAARDRATDPHGGPVVEWAGGSVESVKHGFRSAVAKAGLTGVTMHTLRHTALTWMSQRGVSMRDMSGVAGHTDSRTTEVNYLHHSPEYLRGAVDSLVS